MHLYAQLVHDKTGCHLLEAHVIDSSYFWRFGSIRHKSSPCCSLLQSVVPDLSYTVRSPMLDTWEGIKQLKAALWALVSIAGYIWIHEFFK